MERNRFLYIFEQLWVKEFLVSVFFRRRRNKIIRQSLGPFWMKCKLHPFSFPWKGYLFSLTSKEKSWIFFFQSYFLIARIKTYLYRVHSLCNLQGFYYGKRSSSYCLCSCHWPVLLSCMSMHVRMLKKYQFFSKPGTIILSEYDWMKLHSIA